MTERAEDECVHCGRDEASHGERGVCLRAGFYGNRFERAEGDLRTRLTDVLDQWAQSDASTTYKSIQAWLRTHVLAVSSRAPSPPAPADHGGNVGTMRDPYDARPVADEAADEAAREVEAEPLLRLAELWDSVANRLCDDESMAPIGDVFGHCAVRLLNCGPVKAAALGEINAAALRGGDRETGEEATGA